MDIKTWHKYLIQHRSHINGSIIEVYIIAKTNRYTKMESSTWVSSWYSNEQLEVYNFLEDITDLFSNPAHTWQ